MTVIAKGPDTVTPDEGRARAVASSRRWLAFMALVLGAVAMGVSPVFVRLADVGPFASAFWRVALALPVLWLWMLVDEGRARLPRPDRATVLAGLFFAGDLFFWHLSILNTTVANATFLATLAPVVVVLGASRVLHESISRATVLGLALCLTGAAALLGSSYALEPQRLLGDGFGLVTACFFGAYVLAVRAARRGSGSGRISFLSAVVTTAALLAVALALEDRIWPMSPAGFLPLLGLALVSQVGGQGLLAFALGYLPAAFSSLVIFLEAIAAAAFGWLVLGEALAALQALGGFFILAGIYAARPPAAPRSEPDA